MPLTRLRSGYSRLLRDPKKLGAASLAVADVAGKAIGFIITPYLANRMGASEFGVLSLYISVSQILIYVISLGGEGLLPVEYIRNGYTSARRLRAANLRIALVMAALLLVVSAAVSFAPLGIPLVSGLLIVAVGYVQALNVCELAYYRGAQTYAWAVAGQFGFAILNVVLTVLAFQFDSPTVTNRLLSIALAGGVVQLIYVLELGRKHYEKADKATRRSNTSLIVRFGISIFPHVASQWIRMSVDRFFVTALFGVAAAGIYSVAITVALVGAMLFGVVTQQLQPFLYKRLEGSDFSGFWRIQMWYSAAVLAATAVYYGLLMASFNLFFNSEYDQARALLPIILVGSAFQAIYYVLALTAIYDRRGGQLSLVTGGALLLHLAGLGTLALFHAVSMYYVALVFLFSNAVAMLGGAWLSRRIVMELRSAAIEADRTGESAPS